MIEKRCNNCNQPLQGAYCSNCGQKDIQSLKFTHLFKEFVDHNLDIDSKLFVTLKYLIIKPWFLTIEYWKGKRARYTSPFKTYLLITFIYFLIISISTKEQTDIEVFGPHEKKVARDLLIDQSIDELISSPEREKMAEMFIILPYFTLAFFFTNRKKKSLFLSHHLIAAVHLNSTLFIVDTFLHIVALVFPWPKYAYLIHGSASFFYLFYILKTMNRVYSKSIFWSIINLICMILVPVILFTIYLSISSNAFK